MDELPNRQKEMETRRLEDVAWREKIRADDRAWREKVRVEELAWREKVRAEDRAERDAVNSQNRQCLARGLAFIAATQNAKTGTPPEELARIAQGISQWIEGAAGITRKGS